MNNKYTMSSFQLFALITGAIIANGIMTLPRAVAAHAGRDAWIVVLGTGLLMTVASAVLHRLSAFFPDQQPGQWVITLCGPLLGRVWLGLMVVKTFIFAYLTAKLFAGVVSVRILVYTPTYMVAAGIVFLALIVNQTSLRVIARYSELVFLGKSALLLTLFLPALLGRYYHLRPVLVETSALSYLRAIPAAAFSFVGFEILWFCYPYLKNKNMLVPVGAMGFVTLLYTATTVSATVFFGPERMQYLLLPTLSMISILQTTVLERVDSLFLWLWVGTVSVTAATQYYIGVKCLQGLWDALDFKKTAAFYGAVLLMAIIPTISLPNLYVWADWLGYFDVLLIIGGSIIFLPWALLKARKKGRG